MASKNSANPYNGKVGAVDLVTGKVTCEYYFDPSLILSEGGVKTPKPMASGKESFSATSSMAFKESPSFFQSKHLYVPCTIIKPLVDDESSSLAALQLPPPPSAPPANAPSNTGGQNKKKKKKKGKNHSSDIQESKVDRHEPVAATIIGPNQPYPGPTLVKTSDGVLHKISDSSVLIPLRAADYTGVADVLHLPFVSEAALLHTLRLRYKRDEIYTNAGQILISINPYKNITMHPGNESIYSERVMQMYRDYYRSGGSFLRQPEPAPHLFQVADRAYTALMDSVHGGSVDLDDPSEVSASDLHHSSPVRNQSIIIAGESGAGKTEATKIIMKYLANITRQKNGNAAAAVETLEHRVLSSNPLLETFGNAQTLRNNNSSRFGKFIHIYFSCVTGTITGASISNYLLEKTRITNQVDGERNYHIFYQLLSGPADDIVCQLGLQEGMECFRYLGNQKSESYLTANDNKAFQETVSCLTSIGLSEEEQHSVFAMAAAVLHLGNIQFEENNCSDTAKVMENSIPSLNKACELLGLNVEQVSEAILTKIIVVNGKPIHKPQNVALAEDKRDALAKMTYSNLFLWLVNCVNEKLNDGTSRTASFTDPQGFIGVLDIYGFECFEVNGFEQMLINYCNEKLQRHFNRHLFEVEQQLYSNEGVDWSYITFNDNRLCLELIEGATGSVGILQTLDDAWAGMGTVDKKDMKFLKQILDKFGGSESDVHPHFVASKFSTDRGFTIVHYAGEVKYTVDGFVEKNMETLSNELRELGEKSTDPIAKRVYTYTSIGSDNGLSSPAGTTTRSSIRGVSVGSQFRTSLQALVVELDRTQPHYIRCIKPNLSKASGSFMAGEVLKQLRYSGMMEAIRIRQEGYALREEHESFFDRFSVLLNPEELKRDKGEAGIEQLVKVLSMRLGVSEADWQVGHSKIFLRRELSDKLERLAKLRVYRAARTLTRFGSKVARKRAGTVIAFWFRFRLRLRASVRLNKSASRIEALARGRRQRKLYAKVVHDLILIQSLTRRRIAQKRIREMNDPFVDMTYKDCKQLLASETERMNLALKNNDFQLAKDIKTKLHDINDAIEKKQPISRAYLDKKIWSLKHELESAVKSKSFEECDKLQKKIDELTLKHAELPSLDDLRAAVIAAEVAVSQAAQKRDFQSAAVAQNVLDEAKLRLSEALIDDQDSFDGLASLNQCDSKENGKTRSQLEAEIGDIWAQITEAISEQNFSKANTLQTILEEKENLKLQFPSVEELETKISKTKAEIEECTSKKDFIKASQLNDALATLEKKLVEEKSMESIMKDCRKTSKALSFESRSKLEEEISGLSAMVSKSVAARDFKKADQLQTDIENLMKLRDACPTLGELKQQLQAKKTELEDAVQRKQFSRADSLHCSVKDIEHMIATEQSFVSPTSKASMQQNSKMGAKVTVVSTAKETRASPKMSSDDSISIAKAPIAAASGASVTSTIFQNSVSSVSAPSKASIKMRPVSKLRPSAPLVCETSNTILSVTKLLANKRGNACVVVNENGTLQGILTDTDITRRVVAKFIDCGITAVSDVMTSNPTCVAMTDSALEALMTMVENHFRHLPVVDAEGSVVGLLDIAKCLDDAITNLERKQRKSSKTTESVLKQVVSQQGSIGASAAQLQALITDVLSQAFAGQAMPTLRGVLAGKPKTVVRPDSSIQDAGILMAQDRKAALIVDKGVLVGVFTFKDMMTRAVAKELALTSVAVSEVMTPNPEAVSPDITVLEALQIMHDNRFLTLPVCEDDGTVVGLVDVMDLIYGCGGSAGWRSIFNEAMDVQDDISDAGSKSCNSGSEKFSVGLTKTNQREGDTASITSRKSDHADGKNQPKVDKSVAKLRPVVPCLSGSDDSILSVVQLLKSKRGSACLVVSGNGSLAGILTDTDVTRRVVAKYIDPAITHVSQVMTGDPTCVSLSDSATDALAIMVENHFRHLPVVDELGSVVGLLDIAKCLNDAISKLERVQETSSIAAENAVHQAILNQGGDISQVEALQSVLGNLIAQAFGSRSTPTLRSVLAGKPSTIVGPETSIRDTGIVMANVRKAALIVEDGELVGIFSFKDCMYRAVAMELPLESTPVREVMTPCPESVSPDITVLEALQVMHDHRFLSLPVCEQNGAVVGLVDVMDVIYACGGADGWRSIFNSAMDIDDGSVVASIHTNPKPVTPALRPFAANNSPISTPHAKLSVPTTLEFVDRDDQNSLAGSIGVSKLMSPDDLDESMIGSISNVVVFKVYCTSTGASHRIRCEPRLTDLLEAIAVKTEIPSDRIQIEYEDDEGDSVRITSDDDVIEAYNMARRAGQKLAKLTVSEESLFKSVQLPTFGIEVAAAAVIGTIALLWMRRR